MNRRDELIKSMEETFRKGIEISRAKNTDYARDVDPFSNFKFGALIGINVPKSILSRVIDKIARINNVVDNGGKTAVDENIKETVVDCINYLAILKAYWEMDYVNDTVKK